MTEAIEKNLQECLASFGKLPGAIARVTPDIVSIRCPIPLSFTNGVALARFSERKVEDGVAALVVPYQDDGLPFRWWVTPSSCPASLGDALIKYGMTKRFAIPGMGVQIAEVNGNVPYPENFLIKRVRNVEDLEIWSETFTIGFENEPETAAYWTTVFTSFGFGDDSPWRFYTGFLDGKPVATSSMFIGSAAVGIYHVVTFPEARGLGIGSLMTLEPLHEGRELGFEQGVLQSSDMGLPIYLKLGFKQLFLADFYVWHPPS